MFATIDGRPRATDGNTPPPWWVPSRPLRASGFRECGAFGWNGPAPFMADGPGLNFAFLHHDNIAVWILPDPPARGTLG